MPRHPFIARLCFHFDWGFLVLWGIYLAGPDALGGLGWAREGTAYAVFTGVFFVFHFAQIATGIIALFVVILEIHAQRPVRGFSSVIAALVLPMVSFLYFAGRYLIQVRDWLER